LPLDCYRYGRRRRRRPMAGAMAYQAASSTILPLDFCCYGRRRRQSMA
jgi:hypothetical protein